MYKLTLTKDERSAFDWIGNRYRTGNAVAQLLIQCIPEGKDWEDEGEITFTIPESTAWEIRQCCEDEGGVWPCFSGDLEAKLDAFLGSMV